MKKIDPMMTAKGGIRIQFMVNRKRYSLTPVTNGKFLNRVDYNYACAIAQQISQDIQRECFDETLEKYSPKAAKAIERENNKNNAQLIDLWIEYAESRKKIVSYNTHKLSYSRVRKTIQECPYSSIKDSMKIIKWVASEKPIDYAGYLLQQLNACCKWAAKSDLITTNPFVNYRDILGQKKNKEDYDIDPFSEEERTAIINAFSEKYPNLVNLVEFIFATGCRPSEAVGLDWDNCINEKLIFCKAHVKGRTENKLKTQNKRVVIQNQKIKSILVNQKSKQKKANKNVFTGARGERLNWGYFTTEVWVKVLASLPDIKYRPPYQMRHTFITLALRQGVSPQDVAKHVGNSAEMIFRHYAGLTRDFVMPEI